MSGHSGKAVTLLVSLVTLTAEAQEARVRAAASRAVAVLQKMGEAWKAPCFSCHHQALPYMAYEVARRHGVPVKENSAQRTATRDFGQLRSLDSSVQDHNLIDPSFSEGYFILAARAAGVTPSVSTGAFAQRIARQQRADGHWATFDGRPPHSASLIASTAIAAGSVAAYLPPQLARERAKALGRAHAWLMAAKAEESEDFAFQLLGLKWTSPEANVGPVAEQVLRLQRADGGWAQHARAASDAYATGQILYALAETRAMRPTDAAYQRGIEYLLKTRTREGVWRVSTRIQTAVPVNPKYFESGLPYGHDQFVSTAAVAWAVMALAKALPETPDARPLPLNMAPAGTQPWMETALFGSAAELGRLLDAGLDANAATAAGTSVLMMAAADAEKVRLLLGRGARAGHRAESGIDALMIASLHSGNIDAVRQLLAHGAEANPGGKILFDLKPLTMASYTADLDVVRLLLDRGADVNHRANLIGQAPATALDIACGTDEAELIRELVKRGAALEDATPEGLTQVSLAALFHKNTALRVLLELGANPGHVDKFRMTPLMHARSYPGMPAETAEILKAALESSTK